MSVVSAHPEPVRALVVGASGGVGGALMRRLEADPHVVSVAAWSRTPLTDAHPKRAETRVDIGDEAQIAAAAAALGPVELVLVATGFLHDPAAGLPEKSLRGLSAEGLTRAFTVNAVGPALVAKHVLPQLPRAGRGAFAALSARVGSISDNRLGGWHGYRAAKAALNQLVRTLSIELARSRREALCVALHPGTVDTGLSQPFQDHVAPDKLFAPERAAEQLLGVLNGLTPADSGGFFAWDGSPIPF